MSLSSTSSSASMAREIAPAYSYVSEQLRRLSAGSVQCSLFCGGRGCKYERGDCWDEDDKALSGLFSHWVTPEILAMTRPSTDHIEKHDLVGEFKRLGINSVINLQLPWEHAKCGPGIEHTSGFTYRPEDLMNNGIFFYNYGWVDYGVPTLTNILDMVKVMDFAVKEGKVGVHCHAGLGRTGVLIACYLAYSLRVTGDEAVGRVRRKRPGSIQTRQQIEVVRDFASFLTPLWIMCPSPSTTPLSFEELLHNQRLITHGEDENTHLRHTPKVLHEVCRRILQLLSHDHAHGSCDANMSLNLDMDEQRRYEAIQAEMNSSLQWCLVHSESSHSVLLYLIISFLTSLKTPLLSHLDEVREIVEGDPYYSSVYTMQARGITLLRVLDTLGVLINAVPQDTTPTDPAASPTSLLSKTLSTKLAESLVHDNDTTDITSNTTDMILTLSDIIVKYWKEHS